MTAGALVIGGDIRGVQTALDLADCGIPVTLVEESPSLRAGDTAASLRLMPKLLRARRHPNIRILTNSRIARVDGATGDFRVTVSQQPRYVNADLCTSCARCESECPVSVISPSGDTPDGRKAIHRPDMGLKAVPSTHLIDKKGVPPCTAACPAGVNVPGYVALISQGKFAEALARIRESVPFPRVLGRVCTHPCEKACTRGQFDHPVAICALKRFVSNGSTTVSAPETTPLSGPPRVAIIGSGPAGLTAARDLARLGHRVTVFEALPVPGGMITVGMPRFRLPREVRKADIADITRIGGIEIKTSTAIGRDISLDDLKRQGYEAILIAVGAHQNQKLGIPGEALTGVINSIALLQALNLKQLVAVGRRVVVVGGGYTGIDSARTAVRLRCERVLVVDRCAREDLAANPEEIIEAEEEGVKFEYLVTPVKIVGQDNKVVGIQCRRMKLAERDHTGRRGVTPIEGSDFFIEADTVIVAAGQRPDLSFLKGDTALTQGRKYVTVDPVTMATGAPGIFAAGDAAADPSPIINAIAGGRRAAVSIDRFLRGQPLDGNRAATGVAPVEVNLAEVTVPMIERQAMPCLKYEDRIGNFEEVDLGFNTEMAVREAKRCLNCAVCSNCHECQRVCELSAVDHNASAKQIELQVGAIVVASPPTQPDTVAGPPGLSPAAGPGIHVIPAQSGLPAASAAAGSVMIDLALRDRTTPPTATRVAAPSAASGPSALGLTEPRVGVFVCGCGGSISDVIDVPQVAAYCRGLPGTVVSDRIAYACSDDGAREIRDQARQHHLTDVVLAACACCNLDQICFSCSDRRVQCKSNLLDPPDSVNYEFVNIREHCAWVHPDQPAAATAKAKSIIGAGLARVRVQTPPAATPAAAARTTEKSVLVIGDGLGGMQAAVDLAAQGFATTLVRQSGLETPLALRSAWQDLNQQLGRLGATVIDGAGPLTIAGDAGSYRVAAPRGTASLGFHAGAIVVDIAAGRNGHSLLGDDGRARLLIATGNGDRPPAPPDVETTVSLRPGIFLCGPAAPDLAESRRQGSVAATRASVWLHRGHAEIAPAVAMVDRQRCRGCATCEAACPFEAITVAAGTAAVDEALCRGCGLCVARCPSGALTQRGADDAHIVASLEALLD